VKAITARNNICTVQSYHTYSAVVLRPPINGTDNQMPQVSDPPVQSTRRIHTLPLPELTLPGGDCHVAELSYILPSRDLLQDDLASFKALDLRAEETTGCEPARSTFLYCHLSVQPSQLLRPTTGASRADPAVAIGVGFKYDPNIDIAGGSNDWMYSDRGILAYCTELWHLFKASGVFGEDRMKPHSEVSSWHTAAMRGARMRVYLISPHRGAFWAG
jgi:hypothetical protein